MKYRINQRTQDKISEIGIGSSYMYGAGMDEAVKALRRAVEGGVNYFDLMAAPFQSMERLFMMSADRFSIKFILARTTQGTATAGRWIWKPSNAQSTNS